MMKTYHFSEMDNLRNQIHFTYYSYKYAPAKKQVMPLKSELTNLISLEQNLVTSVIQQDYQKVGSFSFSPDIHPKAEIPCYDFPSFHWLNVKEIAFDSKWINKVQFKTLLVKVPPCEEDSSTEALEKFIHKFIKKEIKEVYTKFPF
mmetsp:Transcript_30309/g.29622  ORF Transcript_30309/g.29622 Transcript_30309/m.29622 type:complete len:146 (+) Transcript_30309:289-726(+)